MLVLEQIFKCTKFGQTMYFCVHCWTRLGQKLTSIGQKLTVWLSGGLKMVNGHRAGCGPWAMGHC